MYIISVNFEELLNCEELLMMRGWKGCWGSEVL